MSLPWDWGSGGAGKPGCPAITGMLGNSPSPDLHLTCRRSAVGGPSAPGVAEVLQRDGGGVGTCQGGHRTLARGQQGSPAVTIWVPPVSVISSLCLSVLWTDAARPL